MNAFYYIEFADKPDKMFFAHPLKRKRNSETKQAFQSLPFGFIYEHTLYLMDSFLGCVYSIEYSQNTLPNLNELYNNVKNIPLKRQNIPFEKFFCSSWKGDSNSQVDSNRCETTANAVQDQVQDPVNHTKVNESLPSEMDFSEISKLESNKSFKIGQIVAALLGFGAIAYTFWALYSMNTNDNDDEFAINSANSITSTKKKVTSKKKRKRSKKKSKSPKSSVLSSLSN